jgi:PAS domain-containing protein
MQINLTTKEFRHLLDLVYIGNWILNSTRGEDRFADYDDLESKLFGLSREHKMGVLTEDWNGIPVPSKAYVEGGIHEAIAYYEDNVFYEILAEELSRRDMEYPEITEENYEEILSRMDRYMNEFRISGVDRLVLDP